HQPGTSAPANLPLRRNPVTHGPVILSGTANFRRYIDIYPFIDNSGKPGSDTEMRKVIATINMTIDGICDHTVIQPGEDIHRHYQDLLNGGDVILYGRITYQLMEFWRTFLDRPSEE